MNSSLLEQIRLPAPGLRDIVRRYVERREAVSSEIEVTLPIRPDLFIDFYFHETLLLTERDNHRRPTGTDVLLVGPHASRMITAHVVGDIHYFSIQLQPTALNRLVGFSTPDIIDSDIPARELLGPSLLQLRDAVLSAVDFNARIVATERWFANALETARAGNSVDEAARLLRRSSGSVSVHALASQVALSERQWRRKFEEQAGLAPKLFSRIVRLDATLDRRRAFPQMSWADIAHKGGYTDQSHMLRDIKALLGTSPATWLSDPRLGAHELAHLQSAGAEQPT